jgi:hypothetical protein
VRWLDTALAFSFFNPVHHQVLVPALPPRVPVRALRPQVQVLRPQPVGLAAESSETPASAALCWSIGSNQKTATGYQ